MNALSTSSYQSSVTDWLDSVKHGSDEAARKIWERFVEQLIREANRQIRDLPRRCADGEDIAQEAFAGFFRGIQEGRFSKMHDRDDLWQVLIVLASRRALDCKRRERSLRRSGTVFGGSVQAHGKEQVESLSLDTVSAPEPTPETVEQVLYLVQACFPALGDEDLQQIALDRFANYSVHEISQRRCVSQRSVERKLKLIRTILQREAASVDSL